MAKHRTHSVEFKRQVVQEFLGGESPHALAKRHGISRNLIKIWVAKYEAGGLDSEYAGQPDARIAVPNANGIPLRHHLRQPIWNHCVGTRCSQKNGDL